jgi:hypothetical protein
MVAFNVFFCGGWIELGVWGIWVHAVALRGSFLSMFIFQMIPGLTWPPMQYWLLFLDNYHYIARMFCTSFPRKDLISVN